MAWAASGIYTGVLNLNLNGATPFPWTLATNKFYVTNNSDTLASDYHIAAASAIYTATNEVHDSTNWPAGGVACSGLATGSTSIAVALGMTGPGPSVVTISAGNISVAATGLASPGAFGGYFYWAANATKYLGIGIYFGGTGYITTGGTFAVNWATNIATITCSTTN